MHNNKNSGFVSVIIVLVISFIALKFYFNFDVLNFIFKYIDKETLEKIDDKIVFYFNLIKDIIFNFYFSHIKPILT